MNTKYVLILLSLCLLACGRHEHSGVAWVKPASDTISCEDYHSLKTAMGILTNNVWNKHAAKDDVWEQCLEKRVIGGTEEYGWSWNWPFGRKVIYSQPQIKVGSSPWAPEPKFGDDFPLEISKLKKLEITHELEIDTNGQHNTANTMWLVKEAYKGSEANPSIIAAEIMIWTYSTPKHFKPAGRKHTEITIENKTWELWYERDWEDKSGKNDNKWAIVTFRAKKPSMKAKVPALRLLNYAIAHKLIPADLYIADVELGNEIMSGAGIAWVKAFNINYEI